MGDGDISFDIKYWRVGNPPLKARVADVVDWMCQTLCTLTGHFGGCWLLTRSPLRHLWWWADDHCTWRWTRGEGAYPPPTSDMSGFAVLETADSTPPDRPEDGR